MAINQLVFLLMLSKVSTPIFPVQALKNIKYAEVHYLQSRLRGNLLPLASKGFFAFAAGRSYPLDTIVTVANPKFDNECSGAALIRALTCNPNVASHYSYKSDSIILRGERRGI